MRLLVIASALLAMAFAPVSQSRAVASDTHGAEPVFLLKDRGWVLSSSRPAFPYNAESPVFAGLSGAATATPFGCGLADIRYSYFSGERGRIDCVSRGPDGRLRLTRLPGRTAYSRVYDAAPADGGRVVVAQVYRRPLVRIMTLSVDGAMVRSVDLPFVDERSPDQVIILPAGRLVVLGKTGQTCVWTVLERSAGSFRAVSATPADHPYQCQSYSGGAGVIRDQLTGAAWLRQNYPEKNALYRIDDNSQGGPAVRVVEDMAAVLPMDAGSDPGLITVLGGVLHYEAPSVSGPSVVRYDLTTRRMTRTDLRAPSGRLSDAGKVYGLMLDGAALRVAVMDAKSGLTEVLPLARD
jgi:hypothetical protein